MIGEILGKALVVVKGDTSHARAEIAKLSAEEQKAAKARVKAQEDTNAAFERSQQKFSIMAAGAVAGWAIVSASVEKYKAHLESLGPAGERELGRIKASSESLTKAQDNLQISIAKLALEIAPMATAALNEMAGTLNNIVRGVGAIVSVAGQLPGASTFGKYAGMAGKAWKYSPFGGGLLAGGADLYGHLAGPDQMDAFSMPMDQVGRERGGPGWGDVAQETVHPAVQAALDRKRKARLSAEWRKKQGYDTGFTLDAAYVGEDATTAVNYNNTRFNYDGPVDKQTRGKVSDGSRDLAAYMRELKLDKSISDALAITAGEEQRESLLAKIFGPVSEFELYTTAWQGLETVVSAGFDAWITGSKSVGAAMKEALHGFAKQLAGEAALQVLRHGAYALGSLAFGDAKGAATHGIAALKWGGVLLAAGAYAKVSAPGGGANANAAAGIGTDGRGGSGRDRSTSLTVVMGDSFAGDSPRYVARKVRRNYENARSYATYGQEGM